MYNNLKFRVGALVLGVTLALAGSAFKPSEKINDTRTLYWFSTNSSGDPQQPLMGEPLCDAETEVYCAKQYDSSDIVFDGNGDPESVISGHEDNQVASRYRD